MKTRLSDYQSFQNAICNEELVFMFGAGMSSALTENNCSWANWISTGIDLIKDRAVADVLKAELDADNSAANMICVVGKVLSITKAEGSYDSWMQSTFEKHAVANQELAQTLKKLLSSGTVFATTNYDLRIEEATGMGMLSYENPDKAFSMLDSRMSTHVIHIHGVYDSAAGIDNIVADDHQYQSVMENQGAQFVQGILGTRTLIFVGCGKTSEDPNISRFIQFARDHLKMDRTYYYLINSSHPVGGLPDNVVSIPYGDQYDDLTPFLEDVAQMRLRAKIKAAPLVGRTAYDNHANVNDDLLRFHYSEQAIPFCGRDEELVDLFSFLNQDAPFSWWTITGQAGSGKSRLAMEFITKLPATWFGFFVLDRATQHDIDSFQPFNNTLVVIDYVAGREGLVANLISGLKNKFAASEYNLRILLLERENTKATGSWYSKLLQRLSRDESTEIAEAEYRDYTLDLVDLSDSAVETFIGAVCAYKGLPHDSVRDKDLREQYRAKFEHLRYRPLFVQLFVEAWINSDFVFPKYESFTGILENVLTREQGRWLEAVDGNQAVCNAFIHLLLRANISGCLDISNLPEFYQPDWHVVQQFVGDHSFPGRQRQEWQNSLINSICQNIDDKNTLIAPLFPDLIKEYMFCFYTEQERLPEMMSEIWQNAPADFSNFIVRCRMDFPEQPFYLEALNAYGKSTLDFDVLTGRLEMLRGRQIREGDDPQIYLDFINNEYQFWSSIAIPESEAEQYDTLAAYKVFGLNLVAKNIGAWSLYDVTEMISVLDEMADIKGGAGTETVKRILLGDQIKILSSCSFYGAAEHLREKLDALITGNPVNELDNCIHMNNLNDKMMHFLMENNIKKAESVLLEMEQSCAYDYLLSAQALARSCVNIESFPFQCGGTLSESGKAMELLSKLEMLYPNDWIIRARRIACQVVGLQKRFFINGEPLKEFAYEMEKLDNELSTMEFNGTASDEALEFAWGTLKTFEINFADVHALRSIANEADLILSKFPSTASVACARIISTRALYKQHLHAKIPHAEVERLFVYLENNPESASVRNQFFEMLTESEDSGKQKDYISRSVFTGALQDAKYNPVMSSGIPEVDLLGSLLADSICPEQPSIRHHKKIGRNEPCPCGSGKKFKKCCLGNGVFD